MSYIPYPPSLNGFIIFSLFFLYLIPVTFPGENDRDRSVTRVDHEMLIGSARSSSLILDYKMYQIGKLQLTEKQGKVSLKTPGIYKEAQTRMIIVTIVVQKDNNRNKPRQMNGQINHAATCNTDNI